MFASNLDVFDHQVQCYLLLTLFDRYERNEIEAFEKHVTRNEPCVSQSFLVLF